MSTATIQHEFIDFFSGISLQLIAVIEQENAFLRDRKYADIALLQADKSRLGFAYENQMKILRDNPMLAQNLSHEQKQQLVDISRKFDKAATDNVILLQSSREINLRILEAIRDSAVEQLQSNQGYSGMKPTAAPAQKRGAQPALSVSVDQVF